MYAAHPDLAGVFATNVLVAQGVDTGLQTAHAASKIKIIGYDADPTQVADLKSGVVEALIAQEPYQEGVDGVEQAVNALTTSRPSPRSPASRSSPAAIWAR